LPENITGLLCYAGGWITGLIFLVTDKRPSVRVHAARSIVIFGGLNVIYVVLDGVILPGLLFNFIRLSMVGLWIILMGTAYLGQPFEIAVVADPTKSLLDRFDKSISSSSNPAAHPALLLASAPATPPRTPDAPFDPAKGQLTIQIIDQMGYWRPNDAIRALGTPVQREFDGQRMQNDTYFYTAPAGRPYKIKLVFDQTQLLKAVIISTHDLSALEIADVLGERPGSTDLGRGWHSYDFPASQCSVIVDRSEFVDKIAFVGLEAKAIFARWDRWAAHLP
jgi:uncharacterized membrane protein